MSGHSHRSIDALDALFLVTIVIHFYFQVIQFRTQLQAFIPLLEVTYMLKTKHDKNKNKTCNFIKAMISGTSSKIINMLELQRKSFFTHTHRNRLRILSIA